MGQKMCYACFISLEGVVNMIDVCFSDCFAGLLKVVQKNIKSDGVFPLWLTLNYGYLDCEDLISQQTRREVETLKYFYKNITDDEMKEEYDEVMANTKVMLQEFEELLNEGHKVRIWLSNNANDRCGLFWICNFLRSCTNEISIVTCPGYEYSDLTNKTTENRNWAAYSNPYFVAEFADDARIILNDEKSAYSRRWEQIVEENAPLRILIDDVIVGVNEDYFDGIILSYVNNEPIPQQTVMGKMLGKWRGCDVAFISQRIEYLIAENIIEVCEDIVDDNDCYWSRTISLV